MNRSFNVFRNISWGILQRVVMMFLPFATRTVIIWVLGSDYLGLNSLFTSILGLLNLAELGVSNAIISSMYKPISEGDKDTICILLNFYRKAYNLIGLIILIVGLLITPFIGFLIKTDVPKDINIYLLYIIYLLNTSISYFGFAYRNCLFLAHQRNDINSKVQSFGILLLNVFQIVLLICFRNFYIFAIVLPIVTLLTNFVTGFLSKKEYPEYICKGHLPIDLKNSIKYKMSGMLLGKVAYTMRSSIDSVFVSAFVGLKAVGMYTNYFYLVTTVAGFFQIIETSLIAGVGNSICEETIEKNYDDFVRLTFVLQWIVGWSSICILCLEQPFMKIWVGEKLMFKDTMVYLCALYLFISCICLIRSTYTQALGMWWSLRILSLFDIFANLLLNYFMGKYFGAYGILAATIIDIAFISLPWTTYFLFKEYFGMKKYWSYMLSYAKYLGIAIIVGFITYYICLQINVSSDYMILLLRIVICVIVPNLLYLVFYFNNKIFKQSIDMIKNGKFL